MALAARVRVPTFPPLKKFFDKIEKICYNIFTIKIRKKIYGLVAKRLCACLASTFRSVRLGSGPPTQ